MSASAAAQEPIAPPLIASLHKDLGNNEIWYIGGTVSVPNSEVIIYLQNERGETLSFNVKTDNHGKWVYSHNAFLQAGSYKSWAQLNVDGQLSPPSSEVSFKVIRTALSIGTFRVSYSTIYLTASAILFLALAALGVFGFYHLRKE